MTKDIIIIGGGGHGRVLIDALSVAKIPIRGICDSNLPAGEAVAFELPVLGDDRVVLEIGPQSVKLVNGIGSVSSMGARDQVFTRFQEAGFDFVSVVHPASIISAHAQLEEGSQIMAGAVVQCGAIIGKNSIVNTSATVDHDCIIGRSVHIAPGVTISGSVEIEDCCHIGIGAKIIQGVKIGKNVVIGAGTVVKESVNEGSVLN